MRDLSQAVTYFAGVSHVDGGEKSGSDDSPAVLCVTDAELFGGHIGGFLVPPSSDTTYALTPANYLARRHGLTPAGRTTQRRHLAELIRLKSRFGWRVNVSRYMVALQAFKANERRLATVVRFSSRNGGVPLYMLPPAVPADTDSVADSLLLLDNDQLQAMESARSMALRAVNQVLGSIASALAAELRRLSRLLDGLAAAVLAVALDCERATGPPPGDPPRLADVASLVCAPRPGPLSGVPVAA